uniref:Glycoside hydrolase 35 catalytic domain-containing protein n=1 Tax=Sinocyclocheilus rhinocerous TaxID=307959 RepID=A0A673L275_9TELE
MALVSFKITTFALRIPNLKYLFVYFGPTGKIRINRSTGLRVNSSQFTLGGKPFRILGGSLHYFRLPRAYWKDRMVKMKNHSVIRLCLSCSDVPWPLHQPEKGELHFQGGLDIKAFLHLAAEVGLWVILRTGPYICSGLDLGGLPREMLLRTTYQAFIAAVNVHFNKLIPKVVPFQFKKGGPVIAVQVENKYGSHARDGNYMSFIKEALQERGISEPNSPVLVMELWTGRSDGWSGLHHNLVAVVREILRRGMSINLYMFHGGTNFGFMNGVSANPFYKALVTSYGLLILKVTPQLASSWLHIKLGCMFVRNKPIKTFKFLLLKGVVFINGQNIGRYWDAGPQQALFLPGPFLNSGMNQVIVFEEAEADFKIQFEDSPDLGMTVDI